MMNANDIIKNTTDFLDDIEKEMVLLNEHCLNFINNFNTYAEGKFLDATILKNRMKDTVKRTVNNDF